MNRLRIWKKVKCLPARKILNVTIQKIRHANMYNSIKEFAIMKRGFSDYQPCKVVPGRLG